MSPVTIYTTPHCPYCLSAKRLLSSKGITPDEINVETSPLHLGGNDAAIPAPNCPTDICWQGACRRLR